jgi:hypothetical protein
MTSTETPAISAADLLQAADDLLRSVVPSTRGIWPRAAAFLIRMALEQAIDELWAREQPSLADCSTRAQLLCLREWVGPAVAQRIAAAWTMLSRACHYHTYELAPTAGELRSWHDDVADLRTKLASARGQG